MICLGIIKEAKLIHFGVLPCGVCTKNVTKVIRKLKARTSMMYANFLFAKREADLPIDGLVPVPA